MLSALLLHDRLRTLEHFSEGDRVDTTSPNGQKELVVSVLPAWSAYATIDVDHGSLGFPPAARGVKTALGLRTMFYDASQTAVARYSAVGFEAAAITRFALAVSKPRTRRGHRREATLRFGHPFAVVAAAFDDHRAAHQGRVLSHWHGLPIFSAWISEPNEAEPPVTDPVSARVQDLGSGQGEVE